MEQSIFVFTVTVIITGTAHTNCVAKLNGSYMTTRGGSGFARGEFPGDVYDTSKTISEVEHIITVAVAASSQSRARTLGSQHGRKALRSFGKYN